MTSHAHAGTVRFGPFVLDLRSGELTGHGTRQHLRDMPFEALVLLLEHPGEVVTRDELRERLWPSDVFVDFENNLNAAVNRLREALGDSAQAPRYVETLPRRGYRLLVPATRDSPAEAPRRPRLVVLPLDNLGSESNCFNQNDRGVIPVAILGRDDFDVSMIKVDTLSLQGLAVKMTGKSNKYLAHIEDVNGDGSLDLVVQFQDSDDWVYSGNGTATLTGRLLDGTSIQGSDSVCIVP